MDFFFHLFTRSIHTMSNWEVNNVLSQCKPGVKDLAKWLRLKSMDKNGVVCLTKC